MSPEYEMLFEHTIRSFLGDKAFGIAGQIHSQKSRNTWYKKSLVKVVKRIQNIESSTTHKEQLSYWSERALNELKGKSFNEVSFTLCLLRLIAVLLGLAGVRPYNIATPAYFQTPSQHYTEVIIEGGDVMQDYYDKKSTLSVRKRLIKQLKSEGSTYFEISLILNISEYEVKKLCKEL
ncbi:hypothetical protein QFX18_11540 [Saccharophagus degradans]|uniref:hypothetical protein n=1 Tax=Saccharophagus degradans TaxID=86304 RepID=UPI002477F35A|nr:hypothetical protein [Saccharophagus degradans]WGO96679.1 hypothetical protein QFX18_11540 [Saccharophagus degradans]